MYGVHRPLYCFIGLLHADMQGYGGGIWRLSPQMSYPPKASTAKHLELSVFKLFMFAVVIRA